MIVIDIPPINNKEGIRPLQYLQTLRHKMEEDPDEPLIFFMSSFDNDERELYEIPEARAAWYEAAIFLGAYPYLQNRLDKMTKDILKLCAGLEIGCIYWCTIEDHQQHMCSPNEEPYG